MPTAPLVPQEFGVYIDKLYEGSALNPYHVILGNSAKENSLVQWCVDEHVTYALLYDLNYWRVNAAYTNTGKTLISTLIAKFSAVNMKVAAVHSGSANTVDAVVNFNAGQPVNKQFRMFAFEDEFWQYSVGSAARTTAFNNLISNLDYAIAALTPINVGIDIYLGHATAAELVAMAQRIPRLFFHDYRLWAEYTYIKQKIRDISDNFGPYTALPICSCEHTNNNGYGTTPNPAVNFAGYAFEGKNSAGVVVGAKKSIFDWWRAFCFTVPGGIGTPNSFQSDTYGAVQANITMPGMILFEQSLMRELDYIHNVPATCGIPGSLSTSAISTTSAQVNWTIGTNATLYNIRYRIVGSPTWLTTTSTVLNKILTGLTAGSNYEFQVQSDCGSGVFSTWTLSSLFTTQSAAVCPLPIGLGVSSLATTTVTLGWTANSVNAYNIRYREVGAGSWTTASTVTNSLALTGLTAATAHEFQVQTGCSPTPSSFSASFNFTTLSATCALPSNLALAALGNTSAQFSWDLANTAVAYNYRYREVGAGSWVTGSTTALFITLSGLISNTDYEFQLQTDCSGSTSSFSSSQLFTTSAFPTPPIITPSGVAGQLDICPNIPLILYSSEPFGNLWSTGETTNSITINSAGIYSVVANGLTSNLVNVVYTSQVIPTAVITGNTTPIQNGATVTFRTSGNNIDPAANYRWEVNGLDVGINNWELIYNLNNGDTVQAFIQNPGSCSPPYVPSNILRIQYPQGPDAPIITRSNNCVPVGGFVELTSSYPGGNLWSTGETTRTIIVYGPGTFTVRAVDGYGGYSEDSLATTLYQCIDTNVNQFTRVGSDAKNETGGAAPEELRPILLRSDNPFGTPNSRVINYGDSLSTLNRRKLKYKGTEDDTYHLVTEFDTIWSIATKYFGDNHLYWTIMDINGLENCFELPVGTTILIPDLVKLKLQISTLS